MNIVNLAQRRQAKLVARKADESLMESNALAYERGEDELRYLIRDGCDLLTRARWLAKERGHQDIAQLVQAALVLMVPPEPPANVVALRAHKAA